MKKILSLILFTAFFIFGYSLVFAFDLEVSGSGGSGFWNYGRYEISKGATISFSCTPSGGTAPYTYCWDFGTSPSNAKLGEWDHDGLQICYSTNQNPSYTFNHYGQYAVWVYVEDNASNSEYALLLIDVSVGGTVINPTTDCGVNNLVGDGTTDNGTNLADCIKSLGTGNCTIEFPAGIYRFVSTNQIRGTSNVPDDFELRPAPGASVTLEFDPTDVGDNTIHKFLDIAGDRDVYIHDLTLNRDLDGGVLGHSDGTQAIYFYGTGGIYTIQDCIIQNFTTGVDSLSNALIERNNFVNWGGRIGTSATPSNCYDLGGGDIECYHSILQGIGDNVLVKNNYSDPYSNGNGHHFYNGSGGYNYVVGYYVDHSGGKTGGMFQLGGADTHKFFYRNILIAAGPGSNDSKFVSSVTDADDMEWIDNRFKEGHLIVYPGSVNGDVIIDYNEFQDTSTDQHAIKYYDGNSSSGLKVRNNEFGSGSGAINMDIHDFDTALKPNFCGDCSHTSTSEPNPNCPCGTWSGNTNTSDTFDFSDPGQWEFDPPQNCSISINGEGPDITLTLHAHDSGSGVGSTPRWPFTEGALMQFSNNGVTWSQVRPYNESTNWILSETQTVYVRFRDRDGNWSQPVSATLGALAAPTGLSIVAQSP